MAVVYCDFWDGAREEAALAMAELTVEDKESLAALKAWMATHKFWTSPASTRLHGNVRGTAEQRRSAHAGTSSC